MAVNFIRKLLPSVRDASVLAEVGLTRNAALAAGDPQKIDFKRITALLLHDQREDMLAKERAFNDRRNDKSVALKARQLANLQGGTALREIRDALKKYLGREHNPAWTAAGWTHNTLAIPNDAAAKSALLGTLIAYFGAHPTHENAGLGATAANATLLKNQIDAAIAAEIATKTPVVQAKSARNAAVNTLHKSLMTLLGELAYEIAPDDARYYDYGFTPPAFDSPPGPCLNFVAQPGPTAGTYALAWEAADHAERYQVQKQIVGTDTDFLLAETVYDNDANLENLPLGAIIRLRVRAVNSHGEGPWSTVLEITV